MSPRIGAYVLPGDPVWLRSSLSRYYDRLEVLVVPVPRDSRGWTGVRIPVQECLDVISEVDVRGIMHRVEGEWVDADAPMKADTAQRQAALDELRLCGGLDWVLQLDNDEVLPDLEPLLAAAEVAAQRDIPGVEWPARVLYRHLGGDRFAECSAQDLGPIYSYPGPVLVRPGSRLTSARRMAGDYLRVTVSGDRRSREVTRPEQPGEHRAPLADASQAIWHCAWARPARAVWRKTRSWGHSEGWRSACYYGTTWAPSRYLWRWQHDIHPFEDGLWPRLRQVRLPGGLLLPGEQPGYVEVPDEH